MPSSCIVDLNVALLPVVAGVLLFSIPASAQGVEYSMDSIDGLVTGGSGLTMSYFSGGYYTFEKTVSDPSGVYVQTVQRWTYAGDIHLTLRYDVPTRPVDVYKDVISLRVVRYDNPDWTYYAQLESDYSIGRMRVGARGSDGFLLGGYETILSLSPSIFSGSHIFELIVNSTGVYGVYDGAIMYYPCTKDIGTYYVEASVSLQTRYVPAIVRFDYLCVNVPHTEPVQYAVCPVYVYADDQYTHSRRYLNSTVVIDGPQHDVLWLETGVGAYNFTVGQKYNISASSYGYQNATLINVTIGGTQSIDVRMEPSRIVLPTMVPIPTMAPMPELQSNATFPGGSLNPIDYIWWISDQLRMIVEWLRVVPIWFVTQMSMYISWITDNIMVLLTAMVQAGNMVLDIIQTIMWYLVPVHDIPIAGNTTTINHTYMDGYYAVWDSVFASVNSTMMPIRNITDVTLGVMAENIEYVYANSSSILGHANASVNMYRLMIGDTLREIPSKVNLTICYLLLLDIFSMIFYRSADL